MTNRFRQIIVFPAVLVSMIIIPCGYAGTVDLNDTNIVFVSSWHKDLPWQREVEDGFIERLKEKRFKPNLFYEYMDSGRFKRRNQVEIFKNYLAEKYAGHQIDYVIYESSAASNLFKAYPELFNNARKIIVNPGPELNDYHPGASTIIPVDIDFEGAVKYLVKASEGKKIYIITGATAVSQELLEQVEEIFARSAPNKKVIPLVGLPMNQLLEQVSTLDSDSVIFYLLFFQDGEGTRFIPYDAARQISEKASVPVYGLFTSYMGSGILGGYLRSGKMVGQEVAEVLMDPEHNKQADAKRLAGKFHGYFFDYNQLKRWGIGENHLPPNSNVLFKKPTFIERYAHELTVGFLAAIILLSLFWNRRLKKEVIERKKAEQRSRESESKYRGLSDAAFEGIAISDKGKILDVNKAMVKMFGYSESELVGMNAMDLVIPNERIVVQEKILSGYEKPYEVLGMTKQGKELPIEAHAKVFSYGDRQVRVTAIRDLTQQKEAEKERRELIKQLNKAQQMAKLGHWELNLKTNALYWSDEIYRIFGLAPQQFTATYETFMETVHPEDRSFVDKTYVESVKNRSPYDIEHRIVLKNGEVKWVREIGSTEYDQDDRPIRSLGTVHDISREKKDQELIRITNQQLQTVLDTVDAMIYVADADTYEVILINKYVRENFGDIVGSKCWESIQTGQDGPCDFCEFKEHRESGRQDDGIHVWQVQNTRNDEWYEHRDEVIEWIDGRQVRLRVATNVSERKKNERERERIIEELQKALAEIKVLQGILPICAYCKKIRNDEGYYEQLEAYIQRHTGADFSHTICDQCLEKHFPDE